MEAEGCEPGGEGREPPDYWGVDSGSALLPRRPRPGSMSFSFHWLFLRGTRRVDSTRPCPPPAAGRVLSATWEGGRWPAAGGAEAAGITAPVRPGSSRSHTPGPTKPLPSPQLQHQSFGVCDGEHPSPAPSGLGSGLEGPGGWWVVRRGRGCQEHLWAVSLWCSQRFL